VTSKGCPRCGNDSLIYLSWKCYPNEGNPSEGYTVLRCTYPVHNPWGPAPIQPCNCTWRVYEPEEATR